MEVELVGTWELTGAEYRAEDGGTVIPYLGSNPHGSLIYTADGRMSVQLMSPGRPLFHLGDRLGGDDAEVRAAFEGYHAYYGRYYVDTEAACVTHCIEGCSYPNFIGTDQKRYFHLVKAGRGSGDGGGRVAPAASGSEGSVHQNANAAGHNGEVGTLDGGPATTADVLTLRTSTLLMRGCPAVGFLVWRRLTGSRA